MASYLNLIEAGKQKSSIPHGMKLLHKKPGTGF